VTVQVRDITCAAVLQSMRWAAGQVFVRSGLVLKLQSVTSAQPVAAEPCQKKKVGCVLCAAVWLTGVLKRSGGATKRISGAGPDRLGKRKCDGAWYR
jgi:hypothetical protein